MAEVFSKNTHFSVSAASSQGDRKQQQDAWGAWFTKRKEVQNQPVIVAAVADGIGSIQRQRRLFPPITGRHAAQEAVQAVGRIVAGLTATDYSTASYLNGAFADASSRIFRKLNHNNAGGENNVGTTLAAVVAKYQPTEDNYAVRFAAVGDTPVFSITQDSTINRLTRLTRDDRGAKKNIITKSVGRAPTVVISNGNLGETLLKKGDQILLATDGITNATFISERRERHAVIVGKFDGLEAYLSNPTNWHYVTRRAGLFDGRRVLSAKKLVQEATKYRGDKDRLVQRDNATAVVIRMK